MNDGACAAAYAATRLSAPNALAQFAVLVPLLKLVPLMILLLIMPLP